MSDRRQILDLFDAQKDFFEKTVKEGIEKHRKGTVKIKVTDKHGNAIQGAKIKIKQKTHEFRFGANIFMLDGLETEEKNSTYKERFVDLFNMATIPFYWDALEPQRNNPRSSRALCLSKAPPRR